MTIRRLVIYHADCVDGFTAAWVAWTVYGTQAEYIPAHYGDDPPDVVGKDVLIVDFSYRLGCLESMCREANGVFLIDHHKTAAQELEPWLSGNTDAPMNMGLLFDMDRSGAGLAWDELVKEPRPKLVDYVEDRDLWRWRLECSREISALIGSYEFSFERWEQLSIYLEGSELRERAIDEGAAILRTADRHVANMVEKAGSAVVGGTVVPFINTTSLTSEILGKLAERAAFACGWFQRADGKFVYSLRSRGDFDVSDVAKSFGGGGHKGAAGFTLDYLLPMEKACYCRSR
jgi:oligoribonuclease NrnB/cAMP/cGMP phosphodiesterase (DHH superfamily)